MLKLRLLCLSGIAALAHSTSVYDGSQSSDITLIANTWPEAPEMSTNWGNLGGGMIPPYIRLSGSKGIAGDWGATFYLGNEFDISQGSIAVSLRASVGAQMAISLVDRTGHSSARVVSTLVANQASTFQTEVIQFQTMDFDPQHVVSLVVWRVAAAAGSYGHFFIDNIQVNGAASSTTPPVAATIPTAQQVEEMFQRLGDNYGFSTQDPAVPLRDGAFSLESSYPQRLAVANDPVLQAARGSSTILLDQGTVVKMKQEAARVPTTGKEVSDIWRNVSGTILRGCQLDSCLANSREVWRDAYEVANETYGQLQPLMVLDAGYAHLSCQDDSIPYDSVEVSPGDWIYNVPDWYRDRCWDRPQVTDHMVLLGFPGVTVIGKQTWVMWDNFHTLTNRLASARIASVHLEVDGSSVDLLPGQKVKLQFAHGGVRKVHCVITLATGSLVQDLFLEVEE